MASKKQQEKKKKDRERTSYAKVMKRREILRADRKEQARVRFIEKEIEAMSHGKPQPILADEERAAERDAAKAKSVAEQLRKNLEILQALEDEYDAESQQRDQINEQLESEGHISIKEKMEALHQKALDQTGKAELLAEAKENYVVNKDKEIDS